MFISITYCVTRFRVTRINVLMILHHLIVRYTVITRNSFQIQTSLKCCFYLYQFIRFPRIFHRSFSDLYTGYHFIVLSSIAHTRVYIKRYKFNTLMNGVYTFLSILLVLPLSITRYDQFFARVELRCNPILLH